MQRAGLARLCVAVAVALPMYAGAQSIHDSKLEAQEPTAALYAASPFLHGYRDGYQQGFHDADLEQQFGRAANDATQSPHYRRVAYKSEFRDRDTYVTGYRAGFERGFADLAAGESFRVFDTLKAVAADGKFSATKSFDFNVGVDDGYMQARGRGTRAKRMPDCGEKKTSGYCSGVAMGAELAKAERPQPR
jgi:hypothetical protein